MPLKATTFLPVNLFLCSLLFSGIAHAQNLAAVSLPDAPGMAASASSYSSSSDTLGDQAAAHATPAADAHQDPQTKRILGVIPNFRAVSANTHLPPQSVKEKFMTATEDSFDYSAFMLPAVLAGYSQATNATPEFGSGGAAYGRYLWHSYVDQASENYFVEFIVPALTHEDNRYYTMGNGGFVKRTGYALSRVVITRNDSGHDTFNAGEVIGAGASSGISNLYYPSPERTVGNTVQKWGLNVGIDAATFVFKEFWPDINHALFHAQK
jgi:hypothetical protein